MKVLIAEDDSKTRGKLAEIVLSLGCKPLMASSGLEAIKQVQENRPDVLLLDGLLPEMHGFEIARFVRNLAADYHPRIVIITGIYKNEHYQDEAKAQFDVDCYLMKPVTRENVGYAIFGGSGPDR
jgi:CheY-like chemotaxis protein